MADNTKPRDPSAVANRTAAPAKRGKTSAPVDPALAEEGKTLGTVVVRNEFYRDGYRLALRKIGTIGFNDHGCYLMAQYARVTKKRLRAFERMQVCAAYAHTFYLE